ncbi:O-antigen ligase family protein [Streptomyces rhizosphaerihabitans]|uniref:O-antigen ligase family protein n=1 Tax=Streptomyces rhizosphaerihabitans TaxID=1266770 RepID=UPI0021C067E6|nr:O-antigen ligase family protein [Streptomyces rhizosphaerihabitans]MCT9005089.1 O-antigen ligase family protein [Streptomyces rhizosphaerihabitans]
MSHALPVTPLDTVTAALRRALPVLPVVAVIALLGLPPSPSAEGGATIADAMSGLVVLCCAIHLVRARRRPLSATAALVLGLPVVGIAVSAAGAADPGAGITGLTRYLQIFVLVPAAVLLLVRDRRDLRLLAWSFVALALWQGAVGVRQYVTGTGASYQGESVRAVGTFGPADVMGMATVVAFGLVCAVALALGTGEARQRSVATLCALALLPPLALSFSRGAWIATAVACGAQLVLAGMRRAVKVGAAVAAAGMILVGGLGVGTAMLQDRVASITQVTDAPDQSVTDRYTMWAAATDMWREHPLTGVGLKGFPDNRDGHASLALSSGSDIAGAGAAFQKQPLLSPHNMYLLVLGEQGLIGLLALAGSWLALLVCALRGLVRVRRTPQDAAGPNLATGRTPPGTDCALVACGLIVWQLVDFVYADIGGPSTVLTAVVFGVIGWWALMDPSAPAVADTTAPAASVPEEAAAR